MARNAHIWLAPSTVYNTWYRLHRGNPYEEVEVCERRHKYKASLELWREIYDDLFDQLCHSH